MTISGLADGARVVSGTMRRRRVPVTRPATMAVHAVGAVVRYTYALLFVW
jgi:hypothetical protein